MKQLALVLYLFANGCTLMQKLNRVETPKAVAFSRYLMISTCYHNEKSCREPVVKDLENANASALFVDGAAQNVVTVMDEGLIFTGTIIFTAKEESFQVDLKLHSGNSEKRLAEKSILTVNDLNKVEETVVMDKPIPFKKGILRAQLVFGPPLNITK